MSDLGFCSYRLRFCSTGNSSIVIACCPSVNEIFLGRALFFGHMIFPVAFRSFAQVFGAPLTGLASPMRKQGRLPLEFAGFQVFSRPCMIAVVGRRVDVHVTYEHRAGLQNHGVTQ